MIVVSDTSPISTLIRCGQLTLLKELYGKILIPRKVFDELSFLIHYNVSIDVLIQSNWIEVKAVSDKNLVEKYNFELDEGEAEAIAIAKEYKADLILADDLAARNFASHLGFKTKGLLGIFIEAESKGLLSNSNLIVQNLIESKIIWISENVYQQYLKALNNLK